MLVVCCMHAPKLGSLEDLAPFAVAFWELPS